MGDFARRQMGRYPSLNGLYVSFYLLFKKELQNERAALLIAAEIFIILFKRFDYFLCVV